MNPRDPKALQTGALQTPTDLGSNAVRDIAGALSILLADMFALYLKTKNFHWHMSGPHFRDYHLMLDEHSDQIFATTDDIAERARKIGGTTLRSIGHIGRLQRVAGQRRRISSRRWICWPNCATTTNSWWPICGKPTICATSTATSPQPA